MIRIVMADDHAIVRSGLRQIFECVPDVTVVGDVANGSELLEQLVVLRVDVVLMEMSLPGINGAELISRIKAKYPHLMVLVLSMYSDVKVVMHALQAGASGFITKNCDLDVLLPAIRAVAAKKTFLAPGLAEKIAFAEASSLHRAPHDVLTDREMQVLCQLTGGVSVNDIALELSISNKTVSTHKAHLLEKLNLRNMSDLMVYAVRHALIDIGQAPNCSTCGKGQGDRDAARGSLQSRPQ